MKYPAFRREMGYSGESSAFGKPYIWGFSNISNSLDLSKEVADKLPDNA